MHGSRMISILVKCRRNHYNSAVSIRHGTYIAYVKDNIGHITGLQDTNEAYGYVNLKAYGEMGPQQPKILRHCE
jgi:hypothetical protein